MVLEFARELEKSNNRIKYKIVRAGGPEYYNLRIYLDGPDPELNKVKKVDYLLHPTFRQRLHSSNDRNDKFAIRIWTWGMFTIHATIHYKDGKKEDREFFLGYDLPKDDGTNYIKV
ncbi:MAG: pYEATS domain-containing protein [Promethearchaeota archaeon]